LLREGYDRAGYFGPDPLARNNAALSPFTSLPPGLTPVAYDEVQRVKTPDWEYGGARMDCPVKPGNDE
jgi:hypothetical protein